MPTSEFIETVTASSADDAYVVLIRLHCNDFPDWDELFRDDTGIDVDMPEDWPSKTLCFCANDENVISNSVTHLAWGFEFIPPGQSDHTTPARIRMDNVDRRIFDAIKLLPPSAKINVSADIVVSSHPDTVEIPYHGFRLSGVSADQISLSGDLTFGNDADEPFCSVFYRPFNSPGIYA